MEENRSCYNCKHFTRHFNVIAGYRIIPLDCGHCHKRRKAKGDCNFPFKDGCLQWEQRIDNGEKDEELLISKLNTMAKDIHSIALILNGEDGDK